MADNQNQGQISVNFPTFPTLFGEKEQARLTELKKQETQIHEAYKAHFSPQAWSEESLASKAMRNVAAAGYLPEWAGYSVASLIENLTPWTETGFTPEQADRLKGDVEQEIQELVRQQTIATRAPIIQEYMELLAYLGQLSGEEAQLYDFIPELNPNEQGSLKLTDDERQWFVDYNKFLSGKTAGELETLNVPYPATGGESYQDLLNRFNVIAPSISPEYIMSTVAFSQDLEKIQEALTMAFPPNGSASFDDVARDRIWKEMRDRGLGDQISGDIVEDLKVLEAYLMEQAKIWGEPYTFTLRSGDTVILQEKEDGFYYFDKWGTLIKVANRDEKGEPAALALHEQVEADTKMFREAFQTLNTRELRADINAAIGNPFNDTELVAYAEALAANPAGLRSIFIQFGRTPAGERVLKALYPNITEGQIADYYSSDAWIVEKEAIKVSKAGGGDWKGTLTAGVGDISTYIGAGIKWLGWESAGDKMIRLGQYMQARAAPVPFEPQDFEWSDMFSASFWSTYGLRQVPTLLTLAVPAMGAYSLSGKLAVGIGTRLGFGTFGVTVLRAIGGGLGATLVARPMESAMEAAAVYEQFRDQGYTHGEASGRAQSIFWGNMQLAGLDMIQTTVAFIPMGGWGNFAKGSLSRGLVRVGSFGGKLFFEGLTEGGEEVYQEMLVKHVNGDYRGVFEMMSDPDMQLVFTLGAGGGIGFGAGMDIYARIKQRTLNSAQVSPTVGEQFSNDVATSGVDQALENLAQTEEGVEIIKEAVAVVEEQVYNEQITEPTNENHTKEMNDIQSKIQEIDEEIANRNTFIEARMEKMEASTLPHEKAELQQEITEASKRITELKKAKQEFGNDLTRLQGKQVGKVEPVPATLRELTSHEVEVIDAIPTRKAGASKRIKDMLRYELSRYSSEITEEIKSINGVNNEADVHQEMGHIFLYFKNQGNLSSQLAHELAHLHYNVENYGITFKNYMRDAAPEAPIEELDEIYADAFEEFITGHKADFSGIEEEDRGREPYRDTNPDWVEAAKKFIRNERLGITETTYVEPVHALPNEAARVLAKYGEAWDSNENVKQKSGLATRAFLDRDIGKKAWDEIDQPSQVALFLQAKLEADIMNNWDSVLTQKQRTSIAREAGLTKISKLAWEELTEEQQEAISNLLALQPEFPDLAISIKSTKALVEEKAEIPAGEEEPSLSEAITTEPEPEEVLTETISGKGIPVDQIRVGDTVGIKNAPAGEILSIEGDVITVENGLGEQSQISKDDITEIVSREEPIQKKEAEVVEEEVKPKSKKGQKKRDKVAKTWNEASQVEVVAWAKEAGIATTDARRAQGNFDALNDVQKERIAAVDKPVTPTMFKIGSMPKVNPTNEQIEAAEMDETVDERVAEQQSEVIQGQEESTIPPEKVVTKSEQEANDFVTETFFHADKENPIDMAFTAAMYTGNMDEALKLMPDDIKEEVVKRIEAKFPDITFQDADESVLNATDTKRVISFGDWGKFGGYLQRYVLSPAERGYMAYLNIRGVWEHRYHQMLEDTGFNKLRPSFIRRGAKKKFHEDTWKLMDNYKQEYVNLTNKKILKKAKIKKILKDYTAEEQEILLNWARELRTLWDEVLTVQNAFRVKYGLNEIPYHESYVKWAYEPNIWGRLMGIFYDGKLNPDFVRDTATTPDFIMPKLRPGQQFVPHALAREGGLAGYDKIMDVERLFLDYTDVAARDIFFTPILQNVKAHIPIIERSAPGLAGWMIDWAAESFAGSRNWVSRAINKTPFRYAVHPFVHLRRRLTMAVFPLNWQWNFFIQTSSIALTVLQAGTRNTTKAGLLWFINGKNRQLIKENCYSYIVKQKRAGSLVYQDIGSQVQRVENARRGVGENLEYYMNFLTRIIEDNITGISCYAGLLKGQKMGLQGRALIDYASEMGAKTQSMYNLQNVPGILRSREVGAVVPFQTFCFEAMNAVREMSGVKYLKTGAYETVAADSIEGKALIRNRLLHFFEFMGAIYVINIIAGLAIGRKPWQPNSFIPMSNLLVAGTQPHNPWNYPFPVRYINELWTSFGEGMEYGNWHGMFDWMVRYHVPGGVQASRTMEGIMAVIQGQVTDVAGDEMFQVEPNEWFKAIFLGVYSTQGGKDWKRTNIVGLEKSTRMVLDELDKYYAQLGTSVGGEYYTLSNYGTDALKLFEDNYIPQWQVMDEDLGFPDLARFRLYCDIMWTEYYGLPVGDRQEYRRDNPYVDATLLFWERAQAARSYQAKEYLDELFKQFGVNVNPYMHTKGRAEIPEWFKLLPE